MFINDEWRGATDFSLALITLDTSGAFFQESQIMLFEYKNGSRNVTQEKIQFFSDEIGKHIERQSREQGHP